MVFSWPGLGIPSFPPIALRSDGGRSPRVHLPSFTGLHQTHNHFRQFSPPNRLEEGVFGQKPLTSEGFSTSPLELEADLGHQRRRSVARFGHDRCWQEQGRWFRVKRAPVRPFRAGNSTGLGPVSGGVCCCCCCF